MADAAATAVTPPKRPIAPLLTPAQLAGRSRGPRTWVLRGYSLFVYAFLFLPILLLIVFAFNDSPRSAQISGFTLHWFPEAAKDPEIRQAVAYTFLIAVVSTAIAVVLGTLAAYALSRYRVLGRSVYDGLFFIPLVIPEIVQAVSLLSFVTASLPGIGKIGVGLPAIVFGHVSFAVAFALVVVQGARLANFDPRLEEASADLGASPWTTFWRVTFPLVLPGIVAGGLLAFTLSFDDLAITLAVKPPTFDTLPVYIYSGLRNGLDVKVNVVAVFMMVVSIAILGIALLLARITSRGGKGELAKMVG